MFKLHSDSQVALQETKETAPTGTAKVVGTTMQAQVTKKYSLAAKKRVQMFVTQDLPNWSEQRIEEEGSKATVKLVLRQLIDQAILNGEGRSVTTKPLIMSGNLDVTSNFAQAHSNDKQMGVVNKNDKQWDEVNKSALSVGSI